MKNDLSLKLNNLAKRVKSILKRSFSEKNRLIIKICLIVSISAFVLFAYILLWQFQNLSDVWEFLITKKRIVLFSSITLFWIIILISSILGNWIWGEGILFAVTTIVMFINSEKMRSRNNPFLPEDLTLASEAGALGNMVNWLNLFFALALVIAIILATFFINKKLSPKLKNHFKKRYTRILRVLFVLISISALINHIDYIRNHTNENFTQVDFLKTEINSYDQAENYRRNGFVIGAVFNLQPKKMVMPEDYSKEKIQSIVKKYQKIASEKNKTLKNLADENVNIVFVMSESFIDPQLGKHLYDYGDQDPIPYTRKISDRSTNGWAISSEYGGGTANVEFEALTGFSNYFLNVMPYSTILSHQANSQSFAKFLSQNNYQTIALHPYYKAMYKRNIVYNNIGFDKYIALEDFKFTDKIDNSQYISDESSYNAIIEELKDNPSKPKFIHLVTMQNHMPYEEGIYNQKTFTVKNNGGQDIEAKAVETYLTGINKSDQALEKFIENLNNSNQKTMVVFWGDHWPGIYSELFGKQKREYDIRRTPLFIYKNFDNGLENQNLNDISLNYLQLAALQQLGVKLSPFQYMLLELQNSYPALTKDFVRQDDDEILHDYRIIEFDMLSGEKWSNGSFYSVN